MQFSLATPEESKKNLADVNKVKVHLTTGIVEILDKHQDLLGKVDLNFLEVENNVENKVEKLKFLIQDGLVVVVTKGLNSTMTKDFIPNTGIYVYAKRILEINANISIDEFSKKIEQKINKLEVEEQAFNDAKINNRAREMEKIKTRISLLEKDLQFEKKIINILKIKEIKT